MRTDIKDTCDMYPPPSGSSGHAIHISRFAVVIPVYNHGNRVREVVERVLTSRLSVIVVDDGSTDSTPQVLQSMSHVKIIRHEKNLGKGASLLSGFAAALNVADWAVTIDADGQHNPDDIPLLMRSIPEGQRPIVVGKRVGMDQENVPWTSRWGRGFSNFWVWASCGKRLSDSQSGFRFYPLPETLKLEAKTRRFQFEVEILVRAVWAGIPIMEVPVRAVYAPPGERISHFRPWLDFWRNTAVFARLIATRILIPIGMRDRKGLLK